MSARSTALPRGQRRWLPSLLLLAVLACAGCAGEHPATRLETLPRPELTALDPIDAEQLSAQQDRVDRLLADPDTGAEQLAEEMGVLGQMYLAFDFDAAARVALQNRLALEPEDVDTLYYLGAVESQANQSEQAAAHFEQALALAPGDARIQLRLAEAYLALDQNEAARALLLESRNDARTAARAHYLLGQLFSATGDPRSAAANYRKALELQPDASQLQGLIADAFRAIERPDLAAPYQARRGDRPVNLLDERMLAIEAYKRGPSTLLLRGTQLLEVGQREEAATLFEQVVALDPENASGYLNLGVTRFQLDQTEAAAAAFEAALALDPTLSKAHYNLGMLHLGALNREAAEVAFRDALEDDPANLEARFELARLLRRDGRCEAAIPEYEAYLRDAPAEAAARLQLILCHAKVEDYRSALAEAEIGHDAEPDRIAFIDALVRLLSASPDDAVRDGTRALELMEPYRSRSAVAEVAELLAMAHAEAGALEQAVADQSQALSAARESNADPRWIEALESNLARYQSGQASRKPWPAYLYEN